VFLIRVLLIFLLSSSSSYLLAANDPTRPPIFGPVKSKPVYNSLVLTMILNDKNNKRAIINESIVAVSDVVANARVIAIYDESVILTRAGKKIVLRMPLADVRKDRVDD
jgi:hypothetical protein